MPEAPIVVANSIEQGLLAIKRYALQGAYVVSTDERPRLGYHVGDVIYTEGWHLGRHARDHELSIHRASLKCRTPSARDLRTESDSHAR